MKPSPRKVLCLVASTGLALTACSTVGASAPAPAATATAPAAKAPAGSAPSDHGPSRLAVGRAGPGTYPAGPCHYRAGTAGTPFAAQALPDHACTPGALNPAVTQADIGNTICSGGWTSTVRPPESYTERLKRVSLTVYGQSGRLGAYEFDHLVPLELGGAPWDPRNLWPEPDNHPSSYYLNSKDEVEDQLKRAVCDHRVTLARAQRAIATNWETAEATLAVKPKKPSME
ncbi:MAG: hypothetical protein ACRDX8_11365 [Acidimicrobiales bacterium]